MTRAIFEAAASKFPHRLPLEEGVDGQYLDGRTNAAWLIWQEAIITAPTPAGSYPACKGMNCGATDGNHSPECQAEHAAAIAGGKFVKPAGSCQASGADDEFETRADGKRVRKDRWECGIRRIVALMWGNRHEFEVDDVVEGVRKLVPEPANDGDDEGLCRAVLRECSTTAPPAGRTLTEPRSLSASVADALRPFLGEGQKVIWREPFRWFDDNGVMSNHYDGMSVSALAAVFGYEVIEDCECAAIIRRAAASNTEGA